MSGITAEEYIAACEFAVAPKSLDWRAHGRHAAYGPTEAALRKVDGYPGDFYIQGTCAKCGWWRFLDPTLPGPAHFGGGVVPCPRCGEPTGYVHQRERRLEPDESAFPREKCEPTLKRVAVARLFLRPEVLP